MAEQREWKNVKPGKQEGQKLKSLLVIQYILKHADEDHPVIHAINFMFVATPPLK